MIAKAALFPSPPSRGDALFSNPHASNPAIASLLQSTRPAGRVAELGSLTLLAHTENHAMSAAVDIYIPAQWDTSVSSVLTAAGFHVTSRARSLAKGILGREHTCTRDGEHITLTEIPLPNDPSYVAILGLSRPKHTAVLLSARDALTQHGALDLDTYNQLGRNHALQHPPNDFEGEHVD